VAISSFTGALSIPTVETMLFNKGKIYIDSSTSSVAGVTQATTTLVGFKATITTGFYGVPSFDGRLDFAFVKQVAPSIKVDFTFEHETAFSVAEKVKWRAQTARVIRLQVIGSTLASTGTSYTNYTLNFDMAGKWEKFGPLTANAGDDQIVGTFRASYESTPALFAQMLVVNESSALA
jgi:hypothetical protein